MVTSLLTKRPLPTIDFAPAPLNWMLLKADVPRLIDCAVDALLKLTIEEPGLIVPPLLQAPATLCVNVARLRVPELTVRLPTMVVLPDMLAEPVPVSTIRLP